jgi:hypothetical protein
MKLLSKKISTPVFIFCCLATNAQNVGIGTTTPVTGFNVAAGKNVLFGDSINTNNARLLWLVSKPAFRAGKTTLLLDTLNFGQYSVAMGYNTTAKDFGTTALGSNAKANGYTSTALGEGGTANGRASMATGFYTTADGLFSTSMGYGTTATADYSLVVGYNNLINSKGLFIVANAVNNGTPFNTLVVQNDNRVGVNTNNPVNTLQIGSMGANNYNGNDIAFGGYGQASGIAQLGSYVHWYSTTNIALMPQSGAGNVGINTTTPQYPLDVAGSIVSPSGAINYFAATTGTGLVYSANGTSYTGIYCENNMLAHAYVALSDARIKNVIGLSNSAKDLQTINALQVTDYTMKDKVQYGTVTCKKVIAQQVETVYPQVVSTHTDFIPNVYQVVNKTEKNEEGILLHFANAHNISSNAKRLKLLSSNNNSMDKVEIVKIVSDKDVIIKTTIFNGDKIFVYGEEVDDLEAVDYEGLATLNISATQELSKQIQTQQNEINQLKEAIRRLNPKLLDEVKQLTAK